MTDAFRAMLPLALITVLGFGLARTGIVKRGWVRVLNVVVYWVSLPAMIITSLAGSQVFDGEGRWWVAGHVAIMAAMAVIVAAVVHWLPLSATHKAVVSMASLTGNAVFIGIPYLDNLQGDSNQRSIMVVTASLYLLLGLVMGIILIRLWVGRHQRVSRQLRDVVASPLVVALVIGVLLSKDTGVVQPVVDAVLHPLRTLAATATPLALLALGAFMAFHPWSKLPGWSLVALPLKLVVLPVLVVLLLGVFRLDTTAEAVQGSVILAAMPMAVTVFVLTEKYHLDTELAARLLVITSVVSVISVPVMGWWLT